MATTSDRPPWALENGLPPAHLIRAALRTASLIDAYGSPINSAQASYALYPSDALYPPQDLQLGERLLIDCELLVEKDRHLYPTSQLSELVSLADDEAAVVVLERALGSAPLEALALASETELAAEVVTLAEQVILDVDRREELLLALGRKFDESERAALGLRGEEFVVKVARDGLTDLGRADLAADVRRLSEFADNLGYDVVAPRIDGKRRLEVKTSGRGGDLFRFFISRSEIDWGLRDPDWALVACRLVSDEKLELLGWCRAQALEPYLPTDSEGGRWAEAELGIPPTLFDSGLPPVV